MPFLDGAADDLFPILYKLFADIEKISTVVRIVGIKEKFNQMLFYYDENGATDDEVKAIDKLVLAAQLAVRLAYSKT